MVAGPRFVIGRTRPVVRRSPARRVQTGGRGVPVAPDWNKQEGLHRRDAIAEQLGDAVEAERLSREAPDLRVPISDQSGQVISRLAGGGRRARAGAQGRSQSWPGADSSSPGGGTWTWPAGRAQRTPIFSPRSE